MYSIIQIRQTSMSRVIASQSTAICSTSVSKSLYGCTSSEKRNPTRHSEIFFYHLDVKLKEKGKKKIYEIVI